MKRQPSFESKPEFRPAHQRHPRRSIRCRGSCVIRLELLAPKLAPDASGMVGIARDRWGEEVGLSG